MYPGGNNYNQNYSNQQPGYNNQQPLYGNSPGFPAGPFVPQIGFNVDMNSTPGYNPGYGAPQPGMNPGYNPYPSNPQPHMPQGYQTAPQGFQGPPQGYQTPSQGYQGTPQGYQAPSQGYQGPAQGYQAPSQGYQIPLQGHEAPSQGYQGPPQGHQSAQQGQYMPGPQPSTQYQQSQYPQPSSQGYSSPCAPGYEQHKPISNQGQPGNPSQYGQTYPQVTQQQTPSYNSSYPSNIGTTNYGTHTNDKISLACIGSAGETYRGTMKPSPNFNVEQDCNVLRKAMKGLGTDEKSIIECLGRRNLSQRLEIKKMFKTMFGKDLIDELKSELSGNFCRAVIESLYDSDHYDAYSLYKAMEGAGTKEDVLTEILTSRSNQQIVNIKEIYKKLFNKNLENDVISETSGFYKRVLVSCLQANKKELTGDEIIRLRQQGPSSVINVNMARQEAQELYNAGEKKIGTDESCFIKIFATRNKYQLKATFDEYQRIANRDIISSIEREMSGDLAASLKAIAMQAINPPLFFATRLYNAIKGAGTNDTAVIRILLTRSEIDLENIKTEFQKQFKKTLDSFVRGDTSGDYMKFLVRFVEGN